MPAKKLSSPISTLKDALKSFCNHINDYCKKTHKKIKAVQGLKLNSLDFDDVKKLFVKFHQAGQQTYSVLAFVQGEKINYFIKFYSVLFIVRVFIVKKKA